MTDLRALLEHADRAVSRVPLRADGLERLRRRRDRKRRDQRIVAGAVGIAVFAAALWIVTTGGPFDRSRSARLPGGGPSVTATPTPSVVPEPGRIVGLPAPGATPSAPERGRLVLSLQGSTNFPWASVWFYADGRVIWGDVGLLPAGAPAERATGFVEQHLTPAWIESLQNQVLSTGLFEHHLALLRGSTDPRLLSIRVRNGDRLVWLTLSLENYRGIDARSATPEQVDALVDVYELLADPTSWPARAWDDEDPETFVPSRYRVWLRLLPDDGSEPPLPVGEREWALLPASARELLSLRTKVNEATYEMTTDETRALAEALNGSGLEPLTMQEDVLRYRLEDSPDPGYSLVVYFGPVLPHGEAVFLGPG